MSEQVCVRMYRPQGLGDCFLLTFPTQSGVANVLIDCGVLSGTDNAVPRMRHLVRRIGDKLDRRPCPNDMAGAASRPYLDVLVVTHEHWDHVSGFIQAAEEFRQICIGEVWLAWTENPADPLAQALREHKTRALKTLDEVRQELHLSGETSALLAALAQFHGERGEDAHFTVGRTAADAMRWAREMASDRVRFLYPGKQPPGQAPPTIPGVGAVKVHVLGPPRDERLKRSNPSRRTPEVYQLTGSADLAFLAAFDDGAAELARPFDTSFERNEEDAAELGGVLGSYFAAEQTWRRIDDDWLGAAEQLALKLDAHTNNTSLVLAFEFTADGRVLLFPGDAQVGSWLSWHTVLLDEDLRPGRDKRRTGSELLAKTVLYKVGHHGSHNATLRDEGLERMTRPDLIAMIPVDEKQAHQQGRSGWEMPFPALLTSLEEKSDRRVLRADAGVPAECAEKMGEWIEETDDYIECRFDLA